MCVLSTQRLYQFVTADKIPLAEIKIESKHQWWNKWIFIKQREWQWWWEDMLQEKKNTTSRVGRPSPWKLKRQAAVVAFFHVGSAASGLTVEVAMATGPLRSREGTRGLTWLSLLPVTSTSKMICPSSCGLWGRGGLWVEKKTSEASF